MKLFVVAAIIGLCAADRLDNKYLPPRGNDGAGYSSGGFNLAPSAAGSKSAGGFGSGSFGASGFRGSGSNFGAGASFGTQHSGNAYNAAPSQFGGSSYSGQQFGGHSNPADVNAQILRSNSEVTADGFSYDFETSNGIRADASGIATNGVQSQGSFAYKGDDGQEYSITYTADENGYQPQGAHLPTPPPIPEAILKSLEQNARDEAAGISDDGQYRGEGAGAGGYPSAGGYSGAGAAGGYSAAAPSNQYGAPARSTGFGAASGKFGAPSGGFGGASAGFNAVRGSSGNFGASSGNYGARSSSFGAATSRQYIPPTAGRASGNGNFNAQSGYRY